MAYQFNEDVSLFNFTKSLTAEECRIWAPTQTELSVLRARSSNPLRLQPSKVHNPDYDLPDEIIHALLTDHSNRVHKEENVKEAHQEGYSDEACAMSKPKDLSSVSLVAPIKDLVTATPDKTDKLCMFCMRMGEPIAIYKSHDTKDPRGKVLCPILQKHLCDNSGATGKNSNTREYPFNNYK